MSFAPRRRQADAVAVPGLELGPPKRKGFLGYADGSFLGAEFPE
jgi:hypothetical protein